MNKSKNVFQDTLISMLSVAGEYSNSYMFYGHMIAQCKHKVTTSLPAPAAVSFEHDSYQLWINPDMFNEFSLVGRLAVLKHEMLHILNGHIGRLEDREPRGWNFATDCAINQQIENGHLPEGSILPDNYPSSKKVPKNQTSEFYYTLLDNKEDPMNEKQDCPNCGGSGEEPNNEGNSNDEEGEEENGNSGNESDDSTKSKPCSCCNGTGKQGAKPLDDHSKWQESVGDADLQKDLTKKMIEQSIQSTEKSRGNIPSNISEYLELHSRNQEVDWRKVLRNIVGNKKANSTRTLMRRDRRHPNRPDIKGKKKDRVFELLVVSDVSGSVDDNALLTLLGEVRHICKVTNTPVNLIQVDTQPMEPEKLAKSTKVIERKACGGTELSPAIKKAEESKLHYDAVVVTTDGYLWDGDITPFGELKKRVIWLIEPNGQIMDEMNQGLMKAFKLKGE